MRLEAIAEASGAHGFGVADLTPQPVRAHIVASGGGWLEAFPRAISVAHRLQDGLVDELPVRHTYPPIARLYDFHIYRTVNDHLDAVADRLATELQRDGFRAVPVPASLSVDPSGFVGAVSHKLVARQAGLGWIGRSCLLVTPAAGPRVRLVSVLTDAPLPVDAPLSSDCGRCRSCVDACPATAFSGRTFAEDEPVSARMDVQACRMYRERAKETSGAAICGVCVAVCPPGRRAR